MKIYTHINRKIAIAICHCRLAARVGASRLQEGANLVYPNFDNIFESGAQPHQNYYKEKSKTTSKLLFRTTNPHRLTAITQFQRDDWIFLTHAHTHKIATRILGLS